MLPVIDLSGPPREQGRTHGRAARAEIAHNLETYLARFEREGALAPGEALRRAGRIWEVVRARHPAYAENLEGVAEGAGQDLALVVALNVRYELLYHQLSALAAEADGCTAFAAAPEATASGHLVMGQNWDWIPEVAGAILHVREPGYEALSFTEAGIVGGKIGLSSYGLGLAINGLRTTADDWARLGTPFHVRCHDILRAPGLAAAASVAAAGPHACSANYLLGHVADGILDVEATPDGSATQGSEAGLLVHTNHLVAATGVAEAPHKRRWFSVYRLERARDLLEGALPLTTAAAHAALSDHEGRPYSVCRHESEAEPEGQRYATVASVVMDVDAGRMWVTDGPPCSGDRLEVALDAPPRGPRVP